MCSLAISNLSDIMDLSLVGVWSKQSVMDIFQKNLEGGSFRRKLIGFKVRTFRESYFPAALFLTYDVYKFNHY